MRSIVVVALVAAVVVAIVVTIVAVISIAAAVLPILANLLLERVNAALQVLIFPASQAVAAVALLEIAQPIDLLAKADRFAARNAAVLREPVDTLVDTLDARANITIVVTLLAITLLAIALAVAVILILRRGRRGCSDQPDQRGRHQKRLHRRHSIKPQLVPGFTQVTMRGR